MNRPLWQRARKDFIRLVDDDKIPEEHKRLNLHYLRTLPYEAISTAKPIIVEAPEPKKEEPRGGGNNNGKQSNKNPDVADRFMRGDRFR